MNKIIEYAKDLFRGWKSKDGDGTYYWTKDEISKLGSIGMSRDMVSDIVPFFYRTKNSKLINQVEVQKIAEVDYISEQEDYFFKILVNFNRKKRSWVVRDFDCFVDAIEYMEKYIDPVDVESKKFNI